MKQIFTLLFMCCIAVFSTKAQTYIQFNYSSPSVPTVFAGNDTSATIGDTIMISPNVTGGTSPFTYNWSPGTAVIDSTVLNAQFVLTSTTPVTLTLSVTDSNGCAVTDQLTITGATNVKNLSKISVEIYPNPTNGRLVFKGLPVDEHEIQINIYDLNGKVIQRNTLHIENGQGEINISNIPAGVYFTRFQLNAHSFDHKIIIR